MSMLSSKSKAKWLSSKTTHLLVKQQNECECWKSRKFSVFDETPPTPTCFTLRILMGTKNFHPSRIVYLLDRMTDKRGGGLWGVSLQASPKNVPITAYRIWHIAITVTVLQFNFLAITGYRFQICPITAYGRRYNPPLITLQISWEILFLRIILKETEQNWVKVLMI